MYLLHTLHDTTLHYAALHYTTLYYTTLLYCFLFVLVSVSGVITYILQQAYYWCNTFFFLFLLFSLLKRGSFSMQVDTLRKLNSMLGTWSIVKIYCQKNNWARRIIETVFPDYCNALLLHSHHRANTSQPTDTNDGNNNNASSNATSSQLQPQQQQHGKFADALLEPVLGMYDTPHGTADTIIYSYALSKFLLAFFFLSFFLISVCTFLLLCFSAELCVLIETLGAFNISAPELKSVFRLMERTAYLKVPPNPNPWLLLCGH